MKVAKKQMKLKVFNTNQPKLNHLAQNQTKLKQIPFGFGKTKLN